jgi:SAM-dependent methyltransferase
MPSTNYRTRESKTKIGQNSVGWSPFDDLAKEYDAWFDREGRLIFSDEVRAFQSLLQSLPKPWLEICVGSGRFAQALGIETGVDRSIKLVEMARRRGINTFLARGDQELFEEGSFGTVFLIVTLCFLDSPLDVLQEANRILISSGKIVLGLVLKESPWGQFYQAKKAQGHRFYRYATFYKCHEVVRLLVQAGFVTESIVSTLFQKPGELQQVEEPKLGYSPDAGFTIIVAGKRTLTTEDVNKVYR